MTLSKTVHRYERNVNPAIGKVNVCVFCSEPFNHPNHNHDSHYIGGSGEYGCLYDSCGVYHTLQDAVDGLAETFGLGRTRKAKLAKFRHLDLNPGRNGADYCEIQVCNCSTPWVHDEMMTEDDWNEF